MTYRYDDRAAQVVENLAKEGISKKQIAVALGIHVDTLVKNYSREIEMGFCELEKEMTGLVIQRAREGNDSMLALLMKSKFGWGQTSKVEHTGADGAPLLAGPPVLNVNFVKKGEEDILTIESKDIKEIGEE